MPKSAHSPRPQPSTLRRSRRERASDPNQDEPKLERIEFYAATVAAWFATAMEFDRALLTLGAAALALLVGLATTGVTDLSVLEAFCFSAALVSFCISMGCILAVFKLNKRYLEEMVHSRDQARVSHPGLKRLDWCGLIFFGLGAFLAMYVAISAVHKKAASTDKVNMNDKNKSSQGHPAFESVDGAMRMRSGNSLNGAVAMAPRATPASKPAASAPSTPQASSGTPKSDK